MIEDLLTLSMFLFRTLSQILVAGVAINAFALLLYASYFNLKDRVARTFVLILVSLVTIYSAEAIGTVFSDATQIDFWLRIEWIGIIVLPAFYYHFSEAVLFTTGVSHRHRTGLVTIAVYIITILLLAGLPFPQVFQAVILDQQPPHLEETWVTFLFTLYYVVVMLLAWRNFLMAYKRTRTPTSRRRMGYLLIAGIAPALGSFPFMLFGSSFAGRHPLVFWVTVAMMNVVVAALINIMAYAVSFYGVSWPQRVIKSRLFKWILRGPILAGIVLAVVTILSRVGRYFNYEGTATVVTIAMLATFLVLQYAITLFRPLGERVFLFNDDDVDIEKLQVVEDRLLTRNDLDQIVELLLSATCDVLQSTGAYLMPQSRGLENFEITIGSKAKKEPAEAILALPLEKVTDGIWANMELENCLVIGVPARGSENGEQFIGRVVVTGLVSVDWSPDLSRLTRRIVTRISNALSDWLATQTIYDSLQEFSYGDEWLMRSRGMGQLPTQVLLQPEVPVESQEVSKWVRDALTQYWGGPKFTSNPLLKFRVVQAALADNENNPSKALRSVLRKAIELTKPEGERKYTSEWLIYNILEMKFLEGRRVKEIALKLSVSEADLYRKQRLAIDTISENVVKMEENSK